MSFQSPEEIPGISVTNFLKYAKNKITGKPVKIFEFKDELNSEKDSESIVLGCNAKAKIEKGVIADTSSIFLKQDHLSFPSFDLSFSLLSGKSQPEAADTIFPLFLLARGTLEETALETSLHAGLRPSPSGGSLPLWLRHAFHGPGFHCQGGCSAGKGTTGKMKKRILIYHVAGIGDTLVALPAFRMIQQNFPDTELHLLNISVAMQNSMTILMAMTTKL